jgi:hypothetical protein
LLVQYGQARIGGHKTAAQKRKEAICRHPFSAVLSHFLRVAQHPTAQRSIGDECLAVLEQFEEIFTWLDAHSHP